MVEKSLLLILIIAYSVFSCNEGRKSEVILTDYGISHNVKDEHIAIVEIKKDNEIREFVYSDPGDPDSLTLYIVKQDLSNDSILLYYRDTVHLFNKKSYMIDGKSWEVKKYYSDAGGIADGAYLLYFNDELGLIAEQSQAWVDFVLFTYGKKKISQYLKKDTVDFFNPFEHVPIN